MPAIVIGMPDSRKYGGHRCDFPTLELTFKVIAHNPCSAPGGTT